MAKQKNRRRPESLAGAGPAADAPFSLDTGDTPGLRAQRLDHLFFEELFRLFRMEVSDPRLSELVPTSVQMSPDLRSAKVMYAIRDLPAGMAKPLPPGEKLGQKRIREEAEQRAINDGLARVTPFLKARLADVVSMRRMPDLNFHRDRLAEGSLRAAEVLTRERLAAAASSQSQQIAQEWSTMAATAGTAVSDATSATIRDAAADNDNGDNS